MVRKKIIGLERIFIRIEKKEDNTLPGNRTPLVKVVEVKLLVTYLIFQLSVTHIGRTGVALRKNIQ